MTCFPNPGNGQMQISGEWNAPGPGVLEISNALGQPVWQGRISTGQWAQHIHLESTGIYFALLRGEKSVVATTRIVVQ
jgi:hypothetical protein